MKKIFLISFLLVPALFAQVEYSSEKNAMVGPGNFFVDYAGYKSDIENKTRIDVFVQVPNSNISFIKKEDRFQGGFNVTLTFWDEAKSNILFERNWKEKVFSDDFAQTLSNSNYFITFKSYDLAPGKYVVKCIVEDSDSRRISAREFPILVREISSSAGLSDLMLISETVKKSDGEKIIPNISSSVKSKETTLSFYFDVYSAKNQDVVLEYTLTDLKKNVSLTQEDPHSLKAGTNLITHTIEKANFSVGNYSVTVRLLDKDRKELTSAVKRFISKIAGVPSSINDLDKAIAQMLYIASPAELEYIKDPKDIDERFERFLAFWEKKKPNPKDDDNPILNEYYRRVDYANKNFRGFGEGWHSDMGMIFITFGPPSAVERHPLDANSKPYEIWEYYEQNRSFVFMDQTGFGDYRLLDPDFSRWPGYRQ